MNPRPHGPAQRPAKQARTQQTPAAATPTAATQPCLRTVTIGTAGHVDHGKSSLVKALTGIDPDTLPEEKAREMTIALGFAPLQLPSGRLLNVVDVPGHDSLVRTMAKGAQGMDAVLLCIASNERVMPQTREHLDILRLLGIHRGLVVLTKADLVDDADERLIIEETIRGDLRGAVLQDAPCVWTSSRTREGLGALLEALDTLVADLPPRDDAGPVRMPVDRAFVIKGFGTVVTGTLLQGTLRPNQQLVLLPQGTEVRVRGLQIQKEDVPEAVGGERPAVNLAGVDAADVPAGSTLADPRAFDTTTRFLAELTLLARARPIERRTELEFLGGTALSQGRASVHLPGRTLRPGETATGELLCHDPLVLVHGDLVLVRDVARNTTVGRARVLDPHPPEAIDHRAAVGLQQAPTVQTATAELVTAAGAHGMPDGALARKVGVLPGALPAFVHTSKTYWSQDAIAQAREALVRAMPAPGARIALADWWATSPVQDRKILGRLTTQIAYWFQLRREGDQLVCPRRAPRPRTRDHPPAPPTARAGRPGRLTLPLLARVEATLRRGGIVTIAAPPQFDHVPPGRASAAVQALCASGRLIRLGRRYAIHPNALDRLVRQITFPTTTAAVAQAFGVSRAPAHALLGYLLRHGRVAFANGHYPSRRAKAARRS